MGDNRSPVKEGPTSFRAIYVMNVETGAFASIGEGVAPYAGRPRANGSLSSTISPTRTIPGFDRLLLARIASA